MIININGFPYSGKNFITSIIKDKYKEIIIIDLDEVRGGILRSIINNLDNKNIELEKEGIEYESFQEEYNKIIRDLKSEKNIIIVVGTTFENNMFHEYIDTHSDYKFFVKLEEEININYFLNKKINSRLINIQEIDNYDYEDRRYYLHRDELENKHEKIPISDDIEPEVKIFFKGYYTKNSEIFLIKSNKETINFKNTIRKQLNFILKSDFTLLSQEEIIYIISRLIEEFNNKNNFKQR